MVLAGHCCSSNTQRGNDIIIIVVLVIVAFSPAKWQSLPLLQPQLCSIVHFITNRNNPKKGRILCHNTPIYIHERVTQNEESSSISQSMGAIYLSTFQLEIGFVSEDPWVPFPSIFTLANMECTMTSITAVRNFIGCSLFRGQSRNRAISHKESAN